MAVNYNDERFAEVEAQKQTALAENEKLYDGMIEKSDKFYQEQINNTQEWGDKQAELQQQQTDFAIEKIEQQKDQAEKDYQKEQRAAHVDYLKQSDPYGANAEMMAANGLVGSGYAESTKIAMYTAYQNRVAIAKESFSKAVLEYDNMMNEARLQNNSALAQIAYETLQEKARLALEGFQYENSLLMEKSNQKTNLNNMYYGRMQDVLNQINTENALAEEKRQFNASLAEKRRQFDVEQANNNLILKGSELGILSKTEFNNQAEAITRGGRRNTGNGGYKLDGVHYSSYDEYVISVLENAYATGQISSEEELNQLLDKYGV